jgi:hypothetical protein
MKTNQQETEDYIKKLERLIRIANDRIDAHYKYGTGIENIKLPKRVMNEKEIKITSE